MEPKSNSEPAASWYEKWSLFEEPHPETQRLQHPQFVFLFSGIFVLGCGLVSVWVILTSVHEWPTSLKVYKSDDPRPLPGYTCACSLPGDWSGPEAVMAKDPAVLHRCYEAEKLETVTILQYDPSITLLGTAMQHITMNDQPAVLRNFTGAYEIEVDSRISEVTLRNGDPKGYFDSLQAYRGIESTTLDLLFDDILDSSGVLDIPSFYVRWGLEFDCTDCSTCSPTHLHEKIPSFSGKEDFQWASCFVYGKSANKCSQDNSYHGKCTLYPTSSVPPLFALREFLHNFKAFQSISNVTGLNPGRRTLNALTLESSFMYLVESNVKEVPTLSWGFTEVDEQHPWWQNLHDMYPNISQECGKMPKVQICHLPKLCSSAIQRLDQDDNSHSHTRCIQQAHDTSSCEDMVASTGMEIDNFWGGDGAKKNQTIRICPRSNSCNPVPPNYVTYKPPTNSRTIGIDSRNYIRGWCTIIYKGIVRHNGSKFLETSCRNGLCYLTGKYNQINDVDGDFHILPLQDYNPKSAEHSFTCYKVKKKSRMRWTIDTFGVLFGWIGTLQLVFVLLLPMLLGFVKEVEEVEEIALEAF